MLFNSAVFIFLFLPLVLIVYFWLNRQRMLVAAKSWLILSSLYFYAYWNVEYLLLIVISILVNYSIGITLHRSQQKAHFRFSRKAVLSAGIVFNLGLLAYFKYADFFIVNVNLAFGSNFQLLDLLLPLAISFFTFQQIAYLVDSYLEDTKEYDFLNYCLFVTFFPQLIAGPIVHHGEMMPQFARLRNSFINWNNIIKGTFIFVLGLFKKVVIADSFAQWANLGYENAHQLGFWDAWGTSLSYTFQLYYDFSAYSDMAIGLALMMNIRLPINFNSPYKATSIQDFWRRWHMTLSRWLRDYVYIPFGGNRKGESRTYINIILTFFLGGLWHGAGWTFVVWGLLHGLALALQKLWQKTGVLLPVFLSWLITFNFVNFTWVFFRAESFGDATAVIKGMLGFKGVYIPERLAEIITVDSALYHQIVSPTTVVYILVFGAVALFLPNTVQMIGLQTYRGHFTYRVTFYSSAVIGLIAGIALTIMLASHGTEFLYFNF